VKEDVTQIVLNVKELLLKSYTDEERTLIIDKQGPGDVNASDIETTHDIEVLNPELLIATLDDADVSFRMEMKVSRGTGYLPVEKMDHRGSAVGTILVDAAFSPVRKVNFRVENARVGRETDYDRLILDVWTTGAVHPKDAVSVSATILKDHMDLFSLFEEEPQVVSPVSSEREEVAEEKESVLDRSIDELGLTVRSHNCLKRMNINTIGDLVMKRESDLLKVRNFGKKSLQEVQEVLAKLGLSLGAGVGSEEADKAAQE
jgi:DNA-directed RNA polymerase subunit alpha